MNRQMGLAASAYRRAAAAVHPTVSVVKLYDEIILAVVQALRAFEVKAHETAFKKVLRAAAILRGLDHSLNHEVGGEVADRLHRVYNSYILALHMNYGKADVAARYGKLLAGLTELRDAWASIAGMRARDEPWPAADPAAPLPIGSVSAGTLRRDELDLAQLALACGPAAVGPAGTGPTPSRPGPARVPIRRSEPRGAKVR